MSTVPLVVDLDGTLIHTDLLHESTLKFITKNPFNIFRLPYWIFQGKAALKAQLADRTQITCDTLPYNQPLLDWLAVQKQAGRKLILCTAAHVHFATQISQHLSIFDEIIASDHATNLSGKRKAQRLEQRFGSGGFDYIGNSKADLPVWKSARRAVVVNASAKVTQKAHQYCEVEKTFPPTKPTIAVYLKTLRVHQWLKNLLLFTPLVLAHQLMNYEAWTTLILAFFSFSFCASSVYITNDLLDIDSDRQHPRKRKRPFAAGRLPAWIGSIMAPCLFLMSLAMSLQVNPAFFNCLLFYFLATCAYSWGLKRLLLIDCITLAILYTIRIIAGAAAAGTGLSFWLLAFSVFLFSSLAFLKRYTELMIHPSKEKQKIQGRGYYTTDASLIQTLGVSAGYTAVSILTLYLNSDAPLKLYRTPNLIWGAVPILLFWISWMWMQAHRGNMHDDPVVFAIKDRASLLAGGGFVLVLILGTMIGIH